MKKEKFVTKIALLTLIAMSLSCHEKVDDLELKIISRSVKCVTNFELYHFEQIFPEYDTFYKQNSRNIISYKIRNNSDKKYLVVLNPDTFEKSWREINTEEKLPYTNYLALDMYDGSKRIIGGDIHSFYGKEDTLKYYYKLYKRGVNLRKNKILNNSKNWLDSESTELVNKNIVIIYPNETKYFSTIVNLPFANYVSDANPLIYNLEANKDYTAGINLYNNSKFTMDYLTKDLKQEVKENGYVVFDGVLKSNQIPVENILIKTPERITTANTR